MVNEKITIKSVEEIQPNIFLMKAEAPIISSEVKPSQFCNIKVSNSSFPLLRRPFSVADVVDNEIHFIFDVHGEGTKLLSQKKSGDNLEVLGPLGNGFNYKKEFSSAIIVAGGLGAAPFPYLTKELKEKNVYSFVGGRSKENVIEYGLKNVKAATDDGSLGFHGNVVQLLESERMSVVESDSIVFACGPTPMLKAVQQWAIENNIEAQLSTECAMACGFGICQGCPVHSATEDKYVLVCKDGPVFEAKEIEL